MKKNNEKLIKFLVFYFSGLMLIRIAVWIWNLPETVNDGHDFFAVYEVAGEAIKRAREGGGPTLVECKSNRYYGHFEGDAQTYRSIDEVKNVKENKDCLMLFAKRVTEQGLLTQAQLDAIDKEVAAEIEASVVHAKSSAKPTEADLLTDVYVSYP